MSICRNIIIFCKQQLAMKLKRKPGPFLRVNDDDFSTVYLQTYTVTYGPFDRRPTLPYVADIRQKTDVDR